MIKLHIKLILILKQQDSEAASYQGFNAKKVKPKISINRNSTFLCCLCERKMVGSFGCMFLVLKDGLLIPDKYIYDTV